MRFAGFAKSSQIGRCDIFGRLLSDEIFKKKGAFCVYSCIVENLV